MDDKINGIGIAGKFRGLAHRVGRCLKIDGAKDSFDGIFRIMKIGIAGASPRWTGRESYIFSVS